MNFWKIFKNEDFSLDNFLVALDMQAAEGKLEERVGGERKDKWR